LRFRPESLLKSRSRLNMVLLPLILRDQTVGVMHLLAFRIPSAAVLAVRAATLAGAELESTSSLLSIPQA
jgi:hypothetical protein